MGQNKLIKVALVELKKKDVIIEQEQLALERKYASTTKKMEAIANASLDKKRIPHRDLDLTKSLINNRGAVAAQQFIAQQHMSTQQAEAKRRAHKQQQKRFNAAVNRRFQHEPLKKLHNNKLFSDSLVHPLFFLLVTSFPVYHHMCMCHHHR
jgi:hypothetical protein